MSDYIKIDERKYWLKCLVNDILGDDGLCEGCKYVDHGSCYKCRRIGANEIIKIIDTDVAPVRHAKWLSKAMRIMCSDCGAEFNDEIVYMLNNYEPMNYCPNCGAKMDEGGSDGTDD